MKPLECALYSTSIYTNSCSECPFNDITSEDLRDIFESTEEVEEEEGNPTQTSFEDDLDSEYENLNSEYKATQIHIFLDQ